MIYIFVHRLDNKVFKYHTIFVYLIISCDMKTVEAFTFQCKIVKKHLTHEAI